MHVSRRFTDATTNTKPLHWQVTTRTRILSSCKEDEAYAHLQAEKRIQRTRIADNCGYQPRVKYVYFSYFSYTPHCEEQNQLSQDSGAEYGIKNELKLQPI